MSDLSNKTVEELRDMFFWSGLQEDEPVMAPFDELASRLAKAQAEASEWKAFYFEALAKKDER